jgi:hypothetical protein
LSKGLEYLVKNQFKDGHWEGDDGKHPVAMTGLTGLALLMERNAPSGRGPLSPIGEPKHMANIRKGVDWLMDKSQAGRDGLIFSEHPSETARYMEGHGLATLFLAGACKIEHDEVRRKKLNEVLTRAVKYIVKAQSSQGGWYHTSKVEGHDFDTISATVIQIQALQAAENAGIPVPSESWNDAVHCLKMALEKNEEKAKPGQSRSWQADIAAALACRNAPEKGAADWYKKWFTYCQTEIPVGRDVKFGRDELTHYYYAQAVFNLGISFTLSPHHLVTLSFLLAVIVFVRANYLQPQSGVVRAVVCLDAQSGDVLWNTPVYVAATEKKHSLNSLATPTPACDGERVYAYFGSALAALDKNGRLLWLKRDPEFAGFIRYGAGSSVVLAGDRIVIYRDSEFVGHGDHLDDDIEGQKRRPSALTAFDKVTGAEVWSIAPEFSHDSYMTPLVWTRDDRLEVVIATWKTLRGE